MLSLIQSLRKVSAHSSGRFSGTTSMHELSSISKYCYCHLIMDTPGNAYYFKISCLISAISSAYNQPEWSGNYCNASLSI